jgi:hypothetical protein
LVYKIHNETNKHQEGVQAGQLNFVHQHLKLSIIQAFQHQRILNKDGTAALHSLETHSSIKNSAIIKQRKLNFGEK